MSGAVTVTTLSESETKIILHVLVESDGTIGEITNYVIYDPTPQFSTLGDDPSVYASGVSQNQAYPNPIFTLPNTLVPARKTSILQVWHGNSWFDMLLRFNALVPITGWVIVRDAEGHNDFRYFGGIKDRTGVESDGKIMISTMGIDGVPSMSGTTIVEIRKD